MPRFLSEATKFLVVLVSILVLVVVPRPVDQRISLLHIPPFFVVCFLICLRVIEIAQEFRKQLNWPGDAEPGASPARLDPPDKPRPPARMALVPPQSSEE